MDELTTFIESEAGPWTWGDLLLAFGILLAMFVLRFIVGTVVKKRLEKLTDRSRTKADDRLVAAVIGFLNLVLPIFGVFAAARILDQDTFRDVKVGIPQRNDVPCARLLQNNRRRALELGRNGR